MEVVDDGSDGSDNGVTFFESFRYKNRARTWRLVQPAELEARCPHRGREAGLLRRRHHPGLEASDLEGFEMMCRIKPKKNPSTGAVTGSTIDWETMQRAAEDEQPVGAGHADGPDDDSTLGPALLSQRRGAPGISGALSPYT